jgi:hypothetical protein
MRHRHFGKGVIGILVRLFSTPTTSSLGLVLSIGLVLLAGKDVLLLVVIVVVVVTGRRG